MLALGLGGGVGGQEEVADVGLEGFGYFGFMNWFRKWYFGLVTGLFFLLGVAELWDSLDPWSGFGYAIFVTVLLVWSLVVMGLSVVFLVRGERQVARVPVWLVVGVYGVGLVWLVILEVVGVHFLAGGR